MSTTVYELRRRSLPLPSRRLLLQAGALGATCVFGLLFVRDGALGHAWHAAAGLPLWTVAVALASIGGGIWFTAVRWRILLRAAGVDMPTRTLFAALAAGAAANNVLPARGGDLVRIAAVRRAAPTASIVGTLAAERLLDGFTLAVWILIGTAAVGVHGPLLVLGVSLAAGTAAALLAAAFLPPAAVDTLVRPLPRRVGPHARDFAAALAPLRAPRVLAPALAASFALWLCDVVMYAAIAVAFHLHLGIGGWFLLEGIGNLALAVPATAAGAGTFDYLTLLGTRSLDIGPAVAGAYVLTVHAFVVLPATALGALLARRVLRSS